MKDNAKKYTVFGTIGATLIILVLVSLVMYKKGYRFTDTWMIGKVGEVHMTIPTISTNIFIDDSQKITTTKDAQDVTIALSPKTHRIIIGETGYFPWTKTFTMPSGGSVTLNPILVTQNTTGQFITTYDPQYWQIKNKVTASVLPTKDKPKTSTDGVKLWVENDSILIEDAAGNIHTVVSPGTSIKNVEFYKGRSDAVLFSTAETVFVIETDTSNTQNIFPVYKGTDPHFIETDPNYIYVTDSDTLMAVVI